jgi:primosomal protein N' (replication factor Y)
MTHQISVLLHTPAHSQVAGALTYLSEQALAPGTLVRVPWGKREVLGVVWDEAADASLDASKLRPIAGTLEGIDPLSAAWRQLVGFAAHYYQRSAGEVALAALPPQLRDLDTQQLGRRLKRHAKSASHAADPVTEPIAMQAVTKTQALPSR